MDEIMAVNVNAKFYSFNVEIQVKRNYVLLTYPFESDMYMKGILCMCSKLTAQKMAELNSV